MSTRSTAVRFSFGALNKPVIARSKCSQLVRFWFVLFHILTQWVREKNAISHPLASRTIPLTDCPLVVPTCSYMMPQTMLKRGVPPAEVLASAPDEAVGEAWRTKAMIRFASSLAKKDSLAPAAAIAIGSQWHNCQEFECLLRHPNEVALWLRNLKT
jgi:hypothetical protein